LERFKKVFLIFWLTIPSVNAQWLQDSTAVCDTIANGGIEPLSKIASDGTGGAYICWRDARDGRGYAIYAQHVDGSGNMTWQRNGISITRLGTNQNFPTICSDDAGGAFIAWEDDRESNTFVYVQRVNRNGDALWQVDGVKAANRPGLFINIAPDGKNGVLIGWILGGCV
jgi:hypothetical protein